MCEQLAVDSRPDRRRWCRSCRNVAAMVVKNSQSRASREFEEIRGSKRAPVESAESSPEPQHRWDGELV